MKISPKMFVLVAATIVLLGITGLSVVSVVPERRICFARHQSAPGSECVWVRVADLGGDGTKEIIVKDGQENELLRDFYEDEFVGQAFSLLYVGFVATVLGEDYSTTDMMIRLQHIMEKVRESADLYRDKKVRSWLKGELLKVRNLFDLPQAPGDQDASSPVTLNQVREKLIEIRDGRGIRNSEILATLDEIIKIIYDALRNQRGITIHQLQVPLIDFHFYDTLTKDKSNSLTREIHGYIFSLELEGIGQTSQISHLGIRHYLG